MESNWEESRQWADRRGALRQNIRVDTLMVEHRLGGVVSARPLDISREGFRFLLPFSIPCGDEVIIHPPEETDLLKLRARIVWQRPILEQGQQWIECGMEAGDTAAWRKHIWFLTLRAKTEFSDESSLQTAAPAA